jgi:hypothetical protein
MYGATGYGSGMLGLGCGCSTQVDNGDGEYVCGDPQPCGTTTTGGGSSTSLNFPQFPGGLPSPGVPVSPPSTIPSTTPSWLLPLTQALKSAGGIFGARYSVPQLNPGQLIQSGPYGTTMYQAPAGSTSLPFNIGLPGSVGGLNIGTLLLIGGGVVLVMMMNKR